MERYAEDDDLEEAGEEEGEEEEEERSGRKRFLILEMGLERVEEWEDGDGDSVFPHVAHRVGPLSPSRTRVRGRGREEWEWEGESRWDWIWDSSEWEMKRAFWRWLRNV